MYEYVITSIPSSILLMKLKDLMYIVYDEIFFNTYPANTNFSNQ